MRGSSARLRTAVDTNLFVSGTFFKRGNPYALLVAWRANAFELLLSDDHRAELTDVFSRPKLIRRYNVSAAEIAELFAGLAAATRVEPSPPIPVTLRDPKDVKILASALGGDADYLVTGDDDLLALRNDPRLGQLKIVTVAEFLALLGGE